MLGLLPEELWIDIIMRLKCNTIKGICEIKQFKLLCDKNNLFERRKMLGFPRESGHCKCHDISKLVTFNKELFDQLFLQSSIFLDETINGIIDVLNDDLVRGDLLYFDEPSIDHYYIYIFNGYTIIKLDSVKY